MQSTRKKNFEKKSYILKEINICNNLLNVSYPISSKLTVKNIALISYNNNKK